MVLALIVASFTREDEPKTDNDAAETNANPTSELIDYEVINHEKSLPHKVSWDIRVGLVDGRLPTEDQLTAISQALQKQNPGAERTFVLFYLPDMEVGAGAFAQAHHDPTLTRAEIQRFMVPEEYKHLFEGE